MVISSSNEVAVIIIVFAATEGEVTLETVGLLLFNESASAAVCLFLNTPERTGTGGSPFSPFDPGRDGDEEKHTSFAVEVVGVEGAVGLHDETGRAGGVRGGTGGSCLVDDFIGDPFAGSAVVVAVVEEDC